VNWLSRVILPNLTWVTAGLVFLIALICGWQIGEARVQREWNAEKLRAALVVARQTQQVADAQQSQNQINHAISNEYEKNSKILASRLSSLSPIGVCNCATASARVVPAIPEATAGTTSATSYALPPSDGDAGKLTCAQLSKDATKTTLMLREMQRWYQNQSNVGQ
jgi:hypothetical protein